jgi:8-oxo-dGTP pyrophosphatase MutT (NUDIX family)
MAVVPWRVLSERMIVERRWLQVREQRVALPNGHEIDEFHLIEGPPWAAALAITPRGEVVMVRQYRHGIGQGSLELPAGVIEPGEPPMLSAERELREETGYEAREWRPLLSVSTEPARHTTRAHFFVALGAELAGPARPEQCEVIDVELYGAAELVRLVETGGIVHGVHVAAILLAERRGFFAPLAAEGGENSVEIGGQGAL